MEPVQTEDRNTLLDDILPAVEETEGATDQPTDAEPSVETEDPAQREESPAEVETTTEETPAEPAQAVDATTVTTEKPPVVDKGLQALQQEVGNLKRMLGEIKTVPAAQQQEVADKIQDALADVETRLQSDDFDPLEAKPVLQAIIKEVKAMKSAPSKVERELAELKAKLAAREEADRVQKYWADFAKEHPGVDGLAIFQEEVQAFIDEGYSKDQAIELGTVTFNRRIKTVKSDPKPVQVQKPTAIRPTPNTPGGSRIVPQSGVRTPQPAKKTRDEMIDSGDLDLLGDV